jgi:two-component system CheB/CheR fusion protein
MAREGLRYELTSTFQKAIREQRPATAHGVRVGTNGGTQIADITVTRLAEPKELRSAVLVIIADAPTPTTPPLQPSRTRPGTEKPRIAELEHEVQQAREEVQTTREEMQTSQEELKSTNEELQSTNEELQSTNEELTTSKEEMQSLNEELQTVNHELQAKVDELSRSNNDMKNLLNSTDIATLFLDSDLNVRRFTTPTARIIKLIPTDVGRPITDIASDLDYPDLTEDAREVLRTLVFRERQAPHRDGRWFTVRTMPYRTLENVISGVVVTFTDASASRALETSLREQASQLRQMAESLPNLMWGARPDGSCDFVSGQWERYTGVPETEQLGYGWLELVHPEDRDRVRDEWRASIKTGKELDVEMRFRGRSGHYRWFNSRSVPIRLADGSVVKWYGANTDIDDLKHAERRRLLDRLGPVMEGVAEGFLTLDGDLKIAFANLAAEKILDRPRGALLGAKILDVVPELRSSALGESLKEAVARRTPQAFTARLDAKSYHVRVTLLTEPDGIAVLFTRGGDGKE